MKKFSERLQEALTERNITAAELSRIIGVNEGTISNYKKGVYEPKQRRLESIANALNISIPWLMGADVPMIESTVQSRLHEAMADKDISPKALCKLTKITIETITEYLNGTKEFNKEDIVSICDALEINAAWLLGHQYIGKNKKPDAVAGAEYEKAINQDYIDALCKDESEDSDLRIIIKIASTISPEKRKQLREMAQVMFPDAYDQ